MKKEEEDEWNLDEPAQKNAGFGGRLLGRKPKKEEPDDDLDNFLDDLEAKRGINTKPPAPVEEKKQRPRTAAAPQNVSFNRNTELDGLDDEEDKQVSQSN